MVSRIQEWAAEQWFNGPQGGTPITAERLNHIEQQVEGLTQDFNNLDGAPEIAFPVTSVNGETGEVALTAADVGASSAGHNHDSAYLAKNSGIQSIVKITQAEYDSLDPKVATTLYVIAGEIPL